MQKKILFLFFLLTCCIFTNKTFAEVLPFQFEKQKATVNFSDSNLKLLTHLSVKEIEKLSGRKLSFKEKIAVKLYKSNPNFYNQFVDSTEEKRLEKKALWAKWLGIGSLISLIVPGVGLLALPAAIIAIVFGTETKNKLKDKTNSNLGIIFGVITIGLILLLVALVILIVSSIGIR